MIKLTFIGAGSIGFTRQLVRDILSVPEFQDAQIALTDISKPNLDLIAKLCSKDIRDNKVSAKLIVTTDRRRAVADADYVINTVRIGGEKAYEKDIEIPLKYGIDQCVGDTLCAGGIMYGQRNIPQLLAFCKDIREVAKPKVLFLNYANPNAMNTWAAIEYGKVNTIGLCHGVINGGLQIAEVLGVEAKDLDYICAGINHQTWYLQLLHKGRRISAEELIAAFEKHPVHSKTEKVRIDVLKRFGYYSTESNGHLSEYVPWYRKRPKEIRQWIDMSEWIHGETGGYLRYHRERRDEFEQEFNKMLAAEMPPLGPKARGLEHGSYIIESLETGRRYRGHFNVRNQGIISNLPDDCIVEVPGYVDRNGVSIPRVGDLPLACAATCLASINVQRMAVQAAVHGDITLLKQAMLHDPLTAAVCNPPEIWQLTDEMLVEQAEWLPQYKNEIPNAKKRLAQPSHLATKAWAGAARKKIGAKGSIAQRTKRLGP